eukprot:475573_1
MNSNNIIYILLVILMSFTQCLSGYCYQVDMTRIRMLKTGGNENDNQEEWDITDAGFKITMKSNFASYSWPASCTYTYHGQFVNNQDAACTPPTNMQGNNGFYNCFMKDFPVIYLTESQMNAGILVKVVAQIGDFDDQFDNGPIWEYELRFQE